MKSLAAKRSATKTKLNQLTLGHYRSEGWTLDSAERYILQARRMKDLFGFIDLMALQPKLPVLAIQVTDGVHHTARRKKILSEPNAKLWLQSGNIIHLVSWQKRKDEIM